jgi:hypothetical protein
MRVKLTHSKTGGEFIATSQRQIDRLTKDDRDGGAWRVAPGKKNAEALKAAATETKEP